MMHTSRQGSSHHRPMRGGGEKESDNKRKLKDTKDQAIAKSKKFATENKGKSGILLLVSGIVLILIAAGIVKTQPNLGERISAGVFGSVFAVVGFICIALFITQKITNSPPPKE